MSQGRVLAQRVQSRHEGVALLTPLTLVYLVYLPKVISPQECGCCCVELPDHVDGNLEQVGPDLCVCMVDI